MAESHALDLGDLVAVDRAIAAARQASDAWERKKFSDPEHATNRDPWTIHRKIAGKSVYDALAARPAMAHEKDIIPALRAHVLSLILTRVTYETDVALAEKVNEPLGIVDLGKPERISWRRAMSGVVVSRARSEAVAYLVALAECGTDVGVAAREHRARRVEAAHRLGEKNAHAHFSPSIAFTSAAARALLDATEDIAQDSVRASLRRADTQYDRASVVDVIAIAAARNAVSGWPSRLGVRWLEELFGAHVRGLAVDPVIPSAVIGASSFARAIEAFGFSFGRAIAFKNRPFVLADDPWASGAHRVAALFGALSASEIFHRRALGLGAEDAEKNARALALTALLEARRRAARLLLGEAAPPSRPLFEEVTFRVFGASLPTQLLGAWPLPCPDEAARFLAALDAPDLSRSFVDRFDEDWFKNPRAFESLRQSLPQSTHASHETGEASENEAVETARHFAHALEQRLA